MVSIFILKITADLNTVFELYINSAVIHPKVTTIAVYDTYFVCPRHYYILFSNLIFPVVSGCNSLKPELIYWHTKSNRNGELSLNSGHVLSLTELFFLLEIVLAIKNMCIESELFVVFGEKRTHLQVSISLWWLLSGSVMIQIIVPTCQFSGFV